MITRRMAKFCAAKFLPGECRPIARRVALKPWISCGRRRKNADRTIWRSWMCTPRTSAKALIAPSLRRQQIPGLTEDSLLPELIETLGSDADCNLGALRSAIVGGDTSRLRDQAHEPKGAGSAVGAEVRGGICRYEIRFNFHGQSTQTTFVNAGSYHQAREIFEGLFPAATLGSIIYQGSSGELNHLPVQPVSEITRPPSKYLFVSHMGSNDSNSKWFDLALRAFQERYPNVKAEYLATSEHSTKKYVQLIERAISMKPDGLVVAITDAAALDGALRRAINQGIPVIAFNAPDLREPVARGENSECTSGQESGRELHLCSDQRFGPDGPERLSRTRSASLVFTVFSQSFGASWANNFSKRGSFRSGSQEGSVLRSP
jgi:hypothetical protein